MSTRSTPSTPVRLGRGAKSNGLEKRQQSVLKDLEINKLLEESISEPAPADTQVSSPIGSAKTKGNGSKNRNAKERRQTQASKKNGSVPSANPSGHKPKRQEPIFTSDEEDDNDIRKQKRPTVIDISIQDSDEDIEELEIYVGRSVHHPIDVDRENPRKRKAASGQTPRPSKRAKTDSLVISSSKLSFLRHVNIEVKKKQKVLGEENGKEYRDFLDNNQSESRRIEPNVRPGILINI